MKHTLQIVTSIKGIICRNKKCEYRVSRFKIALQVFLHFQIIFDINVQIAVFRDLLIHVGTTKDAPELREKIRRVRMQCVEGCQQTNNQLLPQVKRYANNVCVLSLPPNNKNEPFFAY